MHNSEYPASSFENKKELPASYLPYLDTLVKVALARFGAGARALDAFAGSGNSANHLSQAGFDVVALDASSHSLQPNESAPFEQVRASIWNYQPEQLFAVLHAKDPWDRSDIRSSEDLLRYLLKFASLLKPGGVMMVASDWLIPSMPTKMAIHLADFSLLTKASIWTPAATEIENDWYTENSDEISQRGVILCRKNNPGIEKSDSLLSTLFKSKKFGW